MSKQDNWAVGMVHHVCPICCKEVEPEIILPKLISPSTKKQIEKLNGKCVGFASKPCEECQNYINQDYVAIIGFDETKTKTNDGTVNLADLYRLGLLWLRKQVALEIFPQWEEMQRKDNFILVDKQSFEMLMNMAKEAHAEHAESEA